MNENKLLRATVILANIIGLLILLYGGIKNPENVRVFRALDFLQNILLFNLILFLFLPNKKEFNIALLIGIFTMVFDYFLETFAVLLDWWYPLGGIQFPPILIVPLEMVGGFVFLGTCMGIILTFPEKIREIDFSLLNWLKPLFRDPKYDTMWRIMLLFLNAIIGTHGDYSAGPTIWAPGASWHPIYTFMVWFGGGIITLLLFNYLRKKIKEKK